MNTYSIDALLLLLCLVGRAFGLATTDIRVMESGQDDDAISLPYFQEMLNDVMNHSKVHVRPMAWEELDVMNHSKVHVRPMAWEELDVMNHSKVHVIPMAWEELDVMNHSKVHVRPMAWEELAQELRQEVGERLVKGFEAAYRRHFTQKTHPVQNDVFTEKHELSSGISAPTSEWIVLSCTVVLLVIVDLYVIAPGRNEGGMKYCVKALATWIAFALMYNFYYGVRFGLKHGMEWCSGYFLEWLLSMDNLFVFHLIFKGLNTPADFIPKALMVGVAGAIGMKIAFFWSVDTLVKSMTWAQLVFGILLIYSGVTSALDDDDDDDDISESRTVRTLKWLLGDRLTESYDEKGSFFVFEDGKTKVTLLFHVVLCLEACDVLFAIDSVSAKISQIPNVYTAFSSTVLALFGLRAMYFVIERLVHTFEMLKYGIAAVLVFIGIELCISPWVTLTSGVCFVVIIALIAISIAASLTRWSLLESQIPKRDTPASECAGA